MIISKSMVSGFVERAYEVIGRSDGTETWTSPDGDVYALPRIYEAVLNGNDIIEFVEVMLPADLLAEMEWECCDPTYIRRLKGPRLLHPLLVNQAGEIVDGNHRAVKRSKLGHRSAPGVRIADEIMLAARIGGETHSADEFPGNISTQPTHVTAD